MRRVLPVLLAGAAAACVTTPTLPPTERSTVEREAARSDRRYLRVSYYVTPFFGDATKKLLTAVPPDEVRLVNHPNGQPVNPGTAEKILPAGTPARIHKVEFPAPSWINPDRVAYSPQHLPWVYLEVEGEPKELPHILPMQGPLDSAARFLAELEKYLSEHDPERLMAGWSEPVRNAVRTKTPVVDMPAEAVQMALGYPERIFITFNGEVKEERWAYEGGRELIVANGRLCNWRIRPKTPADPELSCTR